MYNLQELYHSSITNEYHHWKISATIFLLKIVQLVKYIYKLNLSVVLFEKIV